MLTEQRTSVTLKERLDRTYLAAARERIFQQRVSTLDIEAEPYSLDDLRLALGVIRLAQRSEVEWLPEDAFEEQPADTESQEVWSAGQIINHTGHSQIEMSSWMLDLAGVDASPGPHPLTDLTDAEHPGLLTREQSLHVLDVADREMESLFDAIPARAELTKQADIPFFGVTGFKGALFLMCIHESSHLDQLRSLRT